MNMRLNLRILLVMSVVFIMASCADDTYFNMRPSSEGSSPATKSGERTVTYNRKVMIFISGGKNSLYRYLESDMKDIRAGYLPTDFAGDDVLVVLHRNGSSVSSYSPTTLLWLYKDRFGNVVQDTLNTWGKGATPVFGSSTISEALTIVRNRFPASSYGLVVSSHGSGYLPDGYYNSPTEYEGAHPLSIGQDVDGNKSVEMELPAFYNSIPYHFDYILFDACFMGGIETAYQLKDKADIIGFSQTEILAEGFDYTSIASRLLKNTPDPVAVCEDYFNQYKDLEDLTNRSATISAVKTAEIDKLAAVCKTLFQKYRTQIQKVDAKNVQRYHRGPTAFLDGLPRPYFFDLRDILVKSGVSDADMAAFDEALAKVVIYEAHTEQFMRSFTLDNCCGLSMFLPNQGSAILKNYYRNNIAWNAATELVN